VVIVHIHGKLKILIPMGIWELKMKLNWR